MVVGRTQIIFPDQLDLSSALDCQVDAINQAEIAAQQLFAQGRLEEIPPHLVKALVAQQRKSELENIWGKVEDEYEYEF